MAIVVPPKEIFETSPSDTMEKFVKTGYDIGGFLRVIHPPEGGMFSYFEGHPVPRAGLQYPEGVIANNQVKRLTVGMFGSLTSFLTLWRGPRAFLESYLLNYCRLTDSIYNSCERVPYLKREYYCRASRGVWTIVETFLQGIGIKNEYVIRTEQVDETSSMGITQTVASRVGQIAATILEFDDAYKTPLIDIMSEFAKREIIDFPVESLKRALSIFSQRSDNEDLKNKVKKIVKWVRLMLWIPKYRRAFRKAFEDVDLKLLQYDESEHYWALPRKGYDARGRSLENRMAEFRTIVKNFITKGEQKSAV